MKQIPLPLPHHEAMSADDFMVADGNREAMAWIEKWPDWPAHCFVIYGPSGSGKTHLAQVFLARSHAQELTAANITTQSATNLIAANKIIIIDNAHEIAGNAEREEALFHIYNAAREAQGFLFLTAPNAPAHWSIALPDLRSRLSSVPAIALTAPDDTLLSALLIKQFRDRQIDIGLDLVNYLLPRLTRTPAAVRDIVERLDHASLAEGRGITVALARRLLEDQQPFANS